MEKQADNTEPSRLEANFLASNWSRIRRSADNTATCIAGSTCTAAHIMFILLFVTYDESILDILNLVLASALRTLFWPPAVAERGRAASWPAARAACTDKLWRDLWCGDKLYCDKFLRTRCKQLSGTRAIQEHFHRLPLTQLRARLLPLHVPRQWLVTQWLGQPDRRPY